MAGDARKHKILLPASDHLDVRPTDGSGLHGHDDAPWGTFGRPGLSDFQISDAPQQSLFHGCRPHQKKSRLKHNNVFQAALALPLPLYNQAGLLAFPIDARLPGPKAEASDFLPEGFWRPGRCGDCFAPVPFKTGFGITASASMRWIFTTFPLSSPTGDT
jgi:hypothetical protein